LSPHTLKLVLISIVNCTSCFAKIANGLMQSMKTRPDKPRLDKTST